MALLHEASAAGLEVHVEAWLHAVLGFRLVDLGPIVGAALDGRALLATTPLEVHGRSVTGEIVQKGLRNFEERHLYFIVLETSSRDYLRFEYFLDFRRGMLRIFFIQALLEPEM